MNERINNKIILHIHKIFYKKKELTKFIALYYKIVYTICLYL